MEIANSNQGAHYDFGVKVNDTSFEAAPDVVLKSLVHLSHMGKQAVESTQKIFQEKGHQAISESTILEPWKQPNELLALAYMEKDTIRVCRCLMDLHVNSHLADTLH